MIRAFEALDGQLDRPARLIVGGGAAMTLAYNYPLSTQDVDAFAARDSVSMAELDALAKRVGKQLDIEPDWLNSHFVTFTHVLPSDYATRLRPVFSGKHLKIEALGPEDLLIMKCFAGRDKDRPHAKKLLRIATQLSRVDEHLAMLVEKRILGAEKAADYFDDLRDEMSL